MQEELRKEFLGHADETAKILKQNGAKLFREESTPGLWKFKFNSMPEFFGALNAVKHFFRTKRNMEIFLN